MAVLFAYVLVLAAAGVVVQEGLHLGRDVQRRVDNLGDRLDFRSQLLFNTMQIETILISDEVDGNS